MECWSAREAVNRCQSPISTGFGLARFLAGAGRAGPRPSWGARGAVRGSGQHFGYREWDAHTSRLARAVAGAGVRPGDRVALGVSVEGAVRGERV